MVESLAIKTLLTAIVNYDDEEKDVEEYTADNNEVNEDEEVDIEKDDFPGNEDVNSVWE